MIPRILSVKCYNGILCACGILHILFALINTNKHFWHYCRGNNWGKDLLDNKGMSTNQHTNIATAWGRDNDRN